MLALLPPWLDQLPSVLLLVFGFGFVIFWHELGHFLAAKWADVKVEQFAVGFGHAILSWRKGLGMSVGSTARKIESVLKLEREQLSSADETDDQIRTRLGIGETEYRLNWLPLGGYVKMLGQDDLNPNSQSPDPRSYNMKSIGKRMVIVSAGVVMNIILAIIGFTILFKIGFDVPPPVVGSVSPHSPAQKAGVQVGDRVVSFDGRPQRDFTKIQLNVALVEEGQAVPLVVRRPDGTEQTLSITAARNDNDGGMFLQLGITPSSELRARLDERARREVDTARSFSRKDVFLLTDGEVIVAVNGQAVGVKDYYRLDKAVQKSEGKLVTITVKGKDGVTRSLALPPHFAQSFGQEQPSFAGFQPRAVIDAITEESSVKGKLFPGDAIISMTVRPGNDTIFNPTRKALRERLQKAGSQDQQVDILVNRDGKDVLVAGLVPNVKLQGGTRGLGIQLDIDEDSTVLGGVIDKSPASEAGIHVDANSPAQTRIVSVAGKPVSTWHDVQAVLAAQLPGAAVPVTYSLDNREKTASLKFTESDLSDIRANRYQVSIQLHDLTDPRHTNNPLVAAKWGLEETRDLIVQFYQTLQRMLISQSVSPKNLMGPVGIFSAGTKFAYRGTDWLIWFLSMISADLAVVNFLPIPIVDGGLFTFLVIEKIQGKPVSPKVQSIAQVIGLALILGIFILVTVQDIARW